jgi:glutathione synthase/RimK-type ligase-like ATP-grasp enzyme
VEEVAAVTTLHNSKEIIAWNSEKSYLKDLEVAGMPVAPTEWFERGETVDLARVMQERGWESGFIKPLVGAVASDTHRLRAGEDSVREAEGFLNARLIDQAMMLQPYLSRVETEGEVSVMLIDGEPTHSVQKLAVAGDYRVQDEHGGTDHLVCLDPSLVALSQRALSVAPGEEPPLYARVDFLFDDEGGAVVNELELVEPMLFFQHHPIAAAVFADAILGLRAE